MAAFVHERSIYASRGLFFIALLTDLDRKNYFF